MIPVQSSAPYWQSQLLRTPFHFVTQFWRSPRILKTVEAIHISVSFLPPFSGRVLCGRELSQRSPCCCLPPSLPLIHLRHKPCLGEGQGLWYASLLLVPTIFPVLPSCSPLVQKCLRELEPRYCLRVLSFIKDSTHGKFELLLINDHCAKWLSILTLDSLWI